MSHRTAKLVALLATLGALFVLAPPATATVPPPPPVGACYNYGWSTYAGETAQQTPVWCSQLHTARTVGTGTMLAGTTLDSVWTQANVAHMSKVCIAALKKAENTTWLMYERVAYTSAIYRPTQAQWDAGARWFRCDAVLPGTGRLFTHPRTTVSLVSPLPNRDRACLDKYFNVVTCVEAHIYRSVSGFGVSASTYPTESQWKTLAQRGCSRLVSTADYAFTWPRQTEFAVGDRAITCFNKSTR